MDEQTTSKLEHPWLGAMMAEAVRIGPRGGRSIRRELRPVPDRGGPSLVLNGRPLMAENVESVLGAVGVAAVEALREDRER